jgi:CubicO group peptidase (beta-lactamase class C family)
MKHNLLAHGLRAPFAVLLATLAAAAAAGPPPSVYQFLPGAAPVPLPAHGPDSRQELEAFVDGVLAVQFKRDHIAGATVVVVKDGGVYFAKGYGYGNVEQRAAVDPGRTLFRAGSVSKLFTWTAVMQLVEQGKLDLDADVNTYLTDFQIPATYARPITLRNLMTHSAGLEDGGIGYLFSRRVADLEPLGFWLARHMPARVRPPLSDFSSGRGVSYSNWGAALAGHIVATVSGLSYDTYVERNIFEPLGMMHSTFREPVPTDIATELAHGYAFEDGAFRDRDFEFAHNIGPAASLSSTATDIARFALAHLQDGTLGDARILKPETARLMHARLLGLSPAMNGVALGFVESWFNGRRTIGHNGDTLYFHSDLMLMPDMQIALFSSYNTLTANAAPSELQQAFLNHYFPATLPAVVPPQDATTRNARYAGTYRTLRRSYSKVEKAFAALVGDIDVAALPDGTLAIANPVDRTPARWVEVGDGVFRKTDEQLYVAFYGGRDGRAIDFVGSFPAPITAERIAGLERGRVHGAVLLVAIVLFLSMLVSAIRNRVADRASPRELRFARAALAACGLLLMAFVVGVIASLSGGLEALIFAYPRSLYVALALPLLSLPLLLASVLFSALLWKRRAWTMSARVHYTTVTIAAIAFIVILHYWNLLGYRFF